MLFLSYSNQLFIEEERLLFCERKKWLYAQVPYYAAGERNPSCQLRIRSLKLPLPLMKHVFIINVIMNDIINELAWFCNHLTKLRVHPPEKITPLPLTKVIFPVIEPLNLTAYPKQCPIFPQQGPAWSQPAPLRPRTFSPADRAPMSLLGQVPPLTSWLGNVKETHFLDCTFWEVGMATKIEAQGRRSLTKKKSGWFGENLALAFIKKRNSVKLHRGQA